MASKQSRVCTGPHLHICTRTSMPYSRTGGIRWRQDGAGFARTTASRAHRAACGCGGRTICECDIKVTGVPSSMEYGQIVGSVWV